jgi:hypothetical protein
VSGHVPINDDGSVAGPFGRVGAEVSPEQGQQAARLALIGILASLKEKLGDLDRIAAWLRVYGMVAPAPGFTAFPALMNGSSSLIRDVFGPAIGPCPRRDRRRRAAVRRARGNRGGVGACVNVSKTR